MPVPLGQFETTASGGDLAEAERRLSGELSSDDATSPGNTLDREGDYNSVCIGAGVHSQPAARRKSSGRFQLPARSSSGSGAGSGACFGPGVQEALTSSQGSSRGSGMWNPLDLVRKRSSAQPKLEPEPVLVQGDSRSAVCAPSSALSAPAPSPGQRTPSGVLTPQEMLYSSASTVGLHRGASQHSSQALGAGQGSSSNLAAALPGAGPQTICNQGRLVAMGNEVEALGLVPKGGAQACIAQEAQVFQVAKGGGLQEMLGLLKKHPLLWKTTDAG